MAPLMKEKARKYKKIQPKDPSVDFLTKIPAEPPSRQTTCVSGGLYLADGGVFELQLPFESRITIISDLHSDPESAIIDKFTGGMRMTEHEKDMLKDLLRSNQQNTTEVQIGPAIDELQVQSCQVGVEYCLSETERITNGTHVADKECYQS